MRRIVLQYNEHKGGKAHHPQQGITVLRPGGQIGGPVAGVDKTHCHQQARPHKFEEFFALMGNARHIALAPKACCTHANLPDL